MNDFQWNVFFVFLALATAYFSVMLAKGLAVLDYRLISLSLVGVVGQVYFMRRAYLKRQSDREIERQNGLLRPAVGRWER